MKTLYYFGTSLTRCGHFTWRLNSPYMQESSIELPFDPEVYPVNPVYRGDSEFHINSGWSIFSIAGSCADDRPGSKTNFLINEEISNEEMVKIIRENTAAMRIINALPFNVKLIPKEAKPCQD